MSAPATPLSANEMRFVFSRAAVGAGAPWGLGEEAAGAALWLAAAGFDPALVMAPALIALRDGGSSGRIETIGPRAARSFEVPGGGIASALYAGPALADALALGAGVTLLRVDAPLVVLAALGAMRPEGRWYVTIDGQAEFALDRDRLTSTSEIDAIEALTGPVSMRIAGLDIEPHPCETRDLAAGRADVIERGVTVGDAGWAVIEACFRNCLVPSSDASRMAGAGAGLMDND